MEIGTGSGYHTAILCKLAREVYSIERVKPLLDEAFEKLLSLEIRNVHFRFGDGTRGLAGGRAVRPDSHRRRRAAAFPKPCCKAQLVDGGIAVLPVGPSDEQMLVEVQRVGDKLISGDICPCRFVKLIGDEGWAEEVKPRPLPEIPLPGIPGEGQGERLGKCGIENENRRC